MSCVIGECVADIGFGAIAHADQVGCDRTASRGYNMGDDVAPKIGRGRVAVEQNDGRAASLVHIGDLALKDEDTLLRERHLGRDG